ncbi:MAG: sulfite exporter TauE/SafE family protein, partial [Thaumarchaeota archaeon]|nr:sulfite exporter TauE/SafE family protein [Nitrososphaerota archaeon]
SQVALMLTISSMIGILIAVPIALLLPIFYFRLYIGILIVTMGVIIVSKYNSRSKFSWKKIMGLGSLAAFNKGLSGGGYGPIIVSGQMLSGIDTKNSIGITALSEGATCFIGVITYFVLGTHIDWVLAPYLLIGSSISVPISVYSVKKIPLKRLTLIIGLATIILGTFSLIQLFR